MCVSVVVVVPGRFRGTVRVPPMPVRTMMVMLVEPPTVSMGERAVHNVRLRPAREVLGRRYRRARDVPAALRARRGTSNCAVIVSVSHSAKRSWLQRLWFTSRS